MRQNSLRHLAGKGTAGGEETRRKIPGVVPADGDGADEGLSQRLGAGGGTGRRASGVISNSCIRSSASLLASSFANVKLIAHRPAGLAHGPSAFRRQSCLREYTAAQHEVRLPTVQD